MKRIIASIVWMQLLSFAANAQESGCTIGDCDNGKGRFVFANQDRYVGEFKHGKPDGRGTYYSANGGIYQGLFQAGKRHGYGTFKWKSGDTYIGEYANDERSGEGAYYFASGEVIQGLWKNGELLEERKVTKPNPTNPDKNGTANNTNGGKPDPLKNGGTGNTARGGNTTNNNPSPNPTTGAGLQKLPALAGKQPNEKRTALVIGNSSYTKAPLRNPKNDASAVAKELQQSGFEVYMYLDIGQKDLKMAIRDFGQILKERGGVGLFYYAGHGLQANGNNYLVPVDAQIVKAQDIEFEAVDLGRVLVEMEYAANATNIIILDACRDNPYKAEFEKDKRANAHSGLTVVNSAPYNSLIAFSTAPGSVALDGTGENGLYTQELLKGMRMKGKKIEDIFKTVRSNVRKTSEGKQIPWENSSIETDFYFKK